MNVPRQGEIWWAEVESFRRPVVIVTRSDAVEVLTSVVVAPVTRTIRDIPTEIRLGVEEGLNDECVASCDSLQRLPRAALTTRIGDLGVRRGELCSAVRAVTDC